jgi:hypothetical protein
MIDDKEAIKKALEKWIVSADQVEAIFKRFDKSEKEYGTLLKEWYQVYARMNKWWNLLNPWCWKKYNKNRHDRLVVLEYMSVLFNAAQKKSRDAMETLIRETI